MISFLPVRSLVLAFVPLLLLGACKSSSGPQAASTASGEILPGSVSDAMLETDRSQAQAPLAPTSHGAASKVDTDALAEASDSAAAASPASDAHPADPVVSAPKQAASPKPTNP